MTYIHSKTGGSKAAALGKWIECKFCIMDHRGELHKIKLIPYDGRPMLVCDDHMERYKEGMISRGLEPQTFVRNYAVFVEEDKEEEDNDNNIKRKVELRIKLNANIYKIGRKLNSVFE